MKEENKRLEDIVALCKRRGFIYQGSSVYGGLSGTWDYGPLGVVLKRNIMNLWWKTFVDSRTDIVWRGCCDFNESKGLASIWTC